MDKILFYVILVAIGGFIIIGGNYFLTDDVGNFSMEKAKNLIPNIGEAIVEKTNEITQTRDINKDMKATKEAERINIEGPPIVIQNEVDSIFEEYIKDWNIVDDNISLTFIQHKVELQKLIAKYSSQRNNWTGNVSDVIETSTGISVLISLDNDFTTLFCKLQNRKMALYLRKGQTITVRGDFEFSMRSPWLTNCEIVTDQ